MSEEQNDALKNDIKIPIARYMFAARYTKNKKVADAACGMGYGRGIMSGDITGFDNSKSAIKYAKENYPGKYVISSIEEINFADYDILVCIETVCHLKNPEKFINNLKVKEFIVSAPINPNLNDGYVYRLHNLTELELKNMIKSKYKIDDELKLFDGTDNYLILHGKYNG